MINHPLSIVWRALCWAVLFTVTSFAQAQSYDSLRVSLLTVDPSPTEVYTIYGHTALRCYDPANQIDAVLNWGMFDAHIPNFIYHFIKGETDYFFAQIPYNVFIREYSWKNATITEQVLNIPDVEKAGLVQFIATNLEPENREYRYNFLFDNCTTRPRDLIEKYCGGTLIYPKQTEPATFRKLIHSCTNPYPWMTFGIDLLIGSGADSLISQHQELFLPEKLKDALDLATITTSTGEKYPIVLSSQILVGEKQPENNSASAHFLLSSCLLSPLGIGILAALCFSILAVTTYKRKSCVSRWPFALLLFAAGAAGCLIAFICLFSEHPCTAPNWNLLWLHPLHWIGMVGFFLKKPYPLIRWYHSINIIVLVILLAAWPCIPQALSIANIPFIGCLIFASIYGLLALKRKRS